MRRLMLRVSGAGLRRVSAVLARAGDSRTTDRVSTALASVLVRLLFWLSRVDCKTCGDDTCDEVHP